MGRVEAVLLVPTVMLPDVLADGVMLIIVA